MGILKQLVQNKVLVLSVIYFAAIIVALPRFNYGELPGPLKPMVGKPFDSYQYIAYVEYFRGNIPGKKELEAPFTYRPLPSLLASVLPFKAETSLNLINLASLLAGVTLIYFILKLLGMNFQYLAVGMCLYIFSFPYFYYGTTGLIDSVFILSLLVLMYLMLRRKWMLFIATFILAAMVKETVLIFFPVLFVFLLYDELSGSRLNRFIIFITAIFCFVLVSIIIRNIVPGESSYVWNPGSEFLIINLLRIKTYLSFSLALGIPGILSVFALKYFISHKKMDQLLLTLTTGIVISCLLSIYALLSAYADGRFIWTAYPFLIPLSVLYLNTKSKEMKNVSD